MRYLHIMDRPPQIGPDGPYVNAEVLEGWLYEYINRDVGGFIPEDEAARLYPEAVAAWRARNDEIGLLSQTRYDELEERLFG